MFLIHFGYTKKILNLNCRTVLTILECKLKNPNRKLLRQPFSTSNALIIFHQFLEFFSLFNSSNNHYPNLSSTLLLSPKLHKTPHISQLFTSRITHEFHILTQKNTEFDFKKSKTLITLMYIKLSINIKQLLRKTIKNKK